MCGEKRIRVGRTHSYPVSCTIIEVLHLQLRKPRCRERENTDQPYFLPTAFFNEMPDVEILYVILWSSRCYEEVCSVRLWLKSCF